MTEENKEDQGLSRRGFICCNSIFNNSYALPYQREFIEASVAGQHVAAANILESIPQGSNPEEEINRVCVVAQGYRYLFKLQNEIYDDAKELVKGYGIDDLDTLDDKLAKLNALEELCIVDPKRFARLLTGRLV